MATNVEGEDIVLAIAQQIVKSLNINTKATEDIILILSSFDNRLSNITDLIDGGEDSDQNFITAEQLILWHDSDYDESFEISNYLQAVDVIINLTENLTVKSDYDSKIMDRAENSLQLAMAKLEDEFLHIFTSIQLV